MKISFNFLLFADKLKVKQKKGKKKKKKAGEEEEEEEGGEKISYSEEITSYDRKAGFDDMNLSRPLLKVSNSCYWHSVCQLQCHANVHILYLL